MPVRKVRGEQNKVKYALKSRGLTTSWQHGNNSTGNHVPELCNPLPNICVLLLLRAFNNTLFFFVQFLHLVIEAYYVCLKIRYALLYPVELLLGSYNPGIFHIRMELLALLDKPFLRGDMPSRWAVLSVQENGLFHVN